MNESSQNSRLLVPALRGTIGRWVYYAALVSMEDIAQRVSFASDVNRDEGINNAIQRDLRGRAVEEIREYLLNQNERFFNSLVVGVYGGYPEWYSVAIRKTAHLKITDIPESTRGILGVLVLRGDEQLFALDGQHRVAGIKEALKRRSRLGSEQVSALFVGHERTDAGKRRTRRLFTTLNRYAKPVSTTDAIIQDEDDAVAIITRDLVNEYPLFAGGRTLISQSRAIPTSDREHFTQIVALYAAMDAYLQATSGMVRGTWKRYKKIRPPENELEKLRRRAMQFWDQVRRRSGPVREVTARPIQQGVAGKYRTKAGGHLLFRPVGLDVFARAVSLLLERGIPLRRAIDRACSAPMLLGSVPWRGVLWNAEARRMLTQKDNRSVAVRLLAYLAVPDLSGRDKRQLRDDWAKVLQVEPATVRLPRVRG